MLIENTGDVWRGASGRVFAGGVGGETASTELGGEAQDRGADSATGCFGGAGRTAASSERQPGVQVAELISPRASDRDERR